LSLIVLVLALPLACAAASKPLSVYFIDVEGGQSTLFVSPSGESMLIDTGWPDQGRSAQRILAAAHDAGIHQIDYLVVTHYHADHVGGVPSLAAVIPIRNFIDHGDPVETQPRAEALYQAYLKVRAKGHHILAKPGMEIPIRGLRVTVLTAAGQHIDQSLPGGGERNSYCPATTQPITDRSENAQSVGVLVSMGKFRMIDLGDLPSWMGEYALMCPTNRVGHVEVYLTTQHAYAESGGTFLVDALHPFVVIGDNGAHKGGAPEALKVVQQSPGLEGFWDVHYSYSASKDLNAQAPYIANLTDHPDNAYWIKLTAQPNGVFTVTNQRNGQSKTYHPRSGSPVP
ncbi:MAG: ComEC/Rec2 family competence protein, partial [Terriglobia bacterium]